MQSSTRCWNCCSRDKSRPERQTDQGKAIVTRLAKANFKTIPCLDSWIRDWLHVNVLQHWNGKRNLASHVRSYVAIAVVVELEQFKTEIDPSRDALANMRRMVDSMPKGTNLQ